MMTVILVGGASLRMGSDKATLETGDGPLALVLAEMYARELGPVAFAVDRPGRFPWGDFVQFEDAFPGKGPLNGLYSAFHLTGCERVFLTAADMPNGSPTLTRYLLAHMGEHDICTIRRHNGFIEPLFSVYHRRCMGHVRELLETDVLSLQELCRRQNVRTIDEEELRAWNLDEVLLNINTPDEYARFLVKRRALQRSAIKQRNQQRNDTSAL